MKALVTGANGLIGANLVRELLAAGHEARAFVRETSDLRSLEGAPVEIVYGDALSVESITRAAEGCDLLFHAAAVFTYWGYSGDELETIAVRGAINALEAAHHAGVRRVVLTHLRSRSARASAPRRATKTINYRKRTPRLI